MYAIVEIAGKQFRVAKDMKLKVPFLDGEAGKKLDFGQVLMVENDKGDLTLGNPVVKNTSVSATILEHGREKKIIVFKKKRRKGYQKKNGHRQDFSMIEITDIGAAKVATAEKSAVKEPAKEAPKEVKAKAVKAAKPAVKTEKPKAAKTATAKKVTKPAAVKKATTAATKPAAAKKATAGAAKPAAKKATTAKKTTTKPSTPKKEVKEK